MNIDTTRGQAHGVLLIDKPRGVSSFFCVHAARKRLGVEKIGHAGTLDPFATGLLILLIGKKWTSQQDLFMKGDKEYEATITLGVATDSFDSEGNETNRAEKVPTIEEINDVLSHFQGRCLQTPPMFSAKKIKGKRLYELARQGVTVEREPVEVTLKTDLIEYSYPYLRIYVACSKGTYIRSIGNDIGQMLGSLGHVSSLRRVRSGNFHVNQAMTLNELREELSITEIQNRLLFPVLENNAETGHTLFSTF